MTIKEALEALREEIEDDDFDFDVDTNEQELPHLPPELAPYFDLYDVHADPNVDYNYLRPIIDQLEGEFGLKVLGMIYAKDEYEDKSYEVDGTFYCDDGQAYFGVGEGPGAYRWFPKGVDELLDAIGVNADDDKPLTKKYCQEMLGNDRAGSIIYDWMINAGYTSTEDFCDEVIIDLCIASTNEQDRITVLHALGEDPEDYED